MKRRIWTVTAGLAALAALIAVPAAMAAYTSAKLEVTQTATGVVVKASLDPNDDPTARVGIIAPTGTQLTTWTDSSGHRRSVHGWCNASRDLVHGADRGWTDAAGPDVPRPDQRNSGSGRACVHRDLLAAARRPCRYARSWDVRREGLQ